MYMYMTDVANSYMYMYMYMCMHQDTAPDRKILYAKDYNIKHK